MRRRGGAENRRRHAVAVLLSRTACLEGSSQRGKSCGAREKAQASFRVGWPMRPDGQVLRSPPPPPIEGEGLGRHRQERLVVVWLWKW